MRKFVLAYFLALITLHLCHSAENPLNAIVRLPNQGVSGVVIYSTAGNTYILTAAHGFHGDWTRTKIVVQVPAGSSSARAGTNPRLLAIDRRADLALIHLAAGPIAPALPIADSANRAPSSQLLSIGYDNMAKALTWEWVDITRPFPGLRRQPKFSAIHTTGFPLPGRSGGALIDTQTGRLVGIVNSRLWNSRGRLGGMYVGTLEVKAFVEKWVPTSRLVNGYTAGRQRNGPNRQIQNGVLPKIGRPAVC